MLIASMAKKHLNVNDATGVDGRGKGGHAYDDDDRYVGYQDLAIRAKGFRIDSLKPYMNSFIILLIMHFW